MAQFHSSTTLVPTVSPNPFALLKCSKTQPVQLSSRRTILWGAVILPNSRSIQPQHQRAAAMPGKLIDAHVHVWASVEDARSGKYPYYVSSQRSSAQHEDFHFTVGWHSATLAEQACVCCCGAVDLHKMRLYRTDWKSKSLSCAIYALWLRVPCPLILYVCIPACPVRLLLHLAQGQMLGSSTAVDEPPMPGHADVLLQGMQVCVLRGSAGGCGGVWRAPGGYMWVDSAVR